MPAIIDLAVQRKQPGVHGTWCALPASAWEVVCRICGTPLPAPHDRLIKYCGAEPCPTSRGSALPWQVA